MGLAGECMPLDEGVRITAILWLGKWLFMDNSAYRNDLINMPTCIGVCII